MSCPDDVRAALDVSRETLDRLERLVALVLKWTTTVNLIAQGTLDDIWTRHVLDSAQIFALAPEGAQKWADIGSGGGFPGVVIAILGRDRPGFSITLVESDQRKATFLRTALRECGVRGNVLARRIEMCEPLGADVLTARALAPLSDLLAHAERHVRTGGVALFPKGARASEEVAEARKTWSFACDVCPSVTDENATILKIGDIARV